MPSLPTKRVRHPLGDANRGSRHPVREALSPPVRDGEPAVPPEGLRGDLRPRGGLPALVFGSVDQGHDTLDDGTLEPESDDVTDPRIVLDVCLEDRVEYVVRGQ